MSKLLLLTQGSFFASACFGSFSVAAPSIFLILKVNNGICSSKVEKIVPFKVFLFFFF